MSMRRLVERATCPYQRWRDTRCDDMYWYLAQVFTVAAFLKVARYELGLLQRRQHARNDATSDENTTSGAQGECKVATGASKE